MYDQWKMRRALSILLILFFGVGPLAALAGSDVEARLPACCRRHGAHHCQMNGIAANEGTSGTNAIGAPSTCPQFPTNAAATTAQYAIAASPMGMPAMLAQPHSPVAGRAAARLSQIRTRTGRGPPPSDLA